MPRQTAPEIRDTDVQGFGDLLRFRRVAARLTQEELADRAGLSARSIVNIEGGWVRRPRPPSVRLLADALGLRGLDRARFERAGRQPQPRSRARGVGGAGPGSGSDLSTAPSGRRRPAAAALSVDPEPVSLLPRDLADFTGRAAEVDTAAAALTRPPAEHTAAPVVVISGPGGIGKTALAVHLSHLLRERFRDGQLFIDLRGTEPTPVAAAEALDRLGRALGAAADPGAGLDQDAERYRLALAQRRLLIVLDDAGSAEQVRPLLPGHPNSAVLVTSRRRLATLAGAYSIDLDVPSDDEALELVARIVGVDRLADDRDAAARLVRLCGRLPLAVRAAGARLAARPHWPVSRLVSRLTDASTRLDQLRTDDLDVRASLAASYRTLDPDTRRAFRLLAALDTPFTGWTAGTLLGVPAAVAEDVLDVIAEARLLSATRSSRQPVHYRMPELVRLFGRELSAAEDAADSSGAGRLLMCSQAAHR